MPSCCIIFYMSWLTRVFFGYMKGALIWKVANDIFDAFLMGEAFRRENDNLEKLFGPGAALFGPAMTVWEDFMWTQTDGNKKVLEEMRKKRDECLANPPWWQL